jgi:hypothetical protein
MKVEIEKDRDIVWLRGEKVGTCFKCKYCIEIKSGGMVPIEGASRA